MSFEHVDASLTRLLGDKEEVRKEYLSSANSQPLDVPHEAAISPLLRDWLAISVTFQLHAPWFSKDDIPFHVLDNPVHRDHVFGAPFMSAASWKGLLRWACRMRTGLLAHHETNNWKDSPEIEHLFGNTRDEDTLFHRGALAFRPTWFDRVGFEVINPHDREKKAGKNPILYEVAPPGTTGTFNLLYAPSPGQAARNGVNAVVVLQLLLNAVEDLVTKYGFSAKRTSGWGIATVTRASIQRQDSDKREGSLGDLQVAVREWLGTINQ